MDFENAKDSAGDKCTQTMNYGADGQLVIMGYRQNTLKTGVTWTVIVLSAFIIRLIFYWKEDFFLKATHSRCSLDEADKVLVVDQYARSFVCSIKTVSADGTVQKLRGKLSSSRRYKSESNQPLLNSVRLDDYENGVWSFKDAGWGSTQGKKRIVAKKKNSSSLLEYFVFEEVKYIWNTETCLFERLKTFPDVTCAYFTTRSPLREEQSRMRKLLFGDNVIRVPITPILQLLVQEALHPFYVFQICSIILWMLDSYEVYATTIAVISILSITITTYETRKMEKALKDMVTSNVNSVVRTVRGDDLVDLEASDLVPGDIIQIPRNGCEMLCDAVLLCGNCIVNESMLTGESVPVSKIPVVQTMEQFEVGRHSRHILFCGTRVIQTRNYGDEPVQAIVYQTGFHTAKGDLVRAIMFPKPIDFKFNNDALNYVKVLSVFAFIGFSFTIGLMIIRHQSAHVIVFRSLDIITTVVPAALPAAMTVGIVISQNRLKKMNRIYCISPNTINVCGSINVVAFDKTGTLTEEGLDLRQVLVADATELWEEQRPQSLPVQSPMLACMASCHSLTFIDDQLCGDPLDLKMFEATGWRLDEPKGIDSTHQFTEFIPRIVSPPAPEDSDEEKGSLEIGLLREFPFSSSLQRMAVLGRILGQNHFTLFLKGSPEIVFSLCDPQTLPPGLNERLSSYTRQGYRVLALAWRQVAINIVRVHRVTRNEVENDLRFVGLLVMENRLKPETIPAIDVLRRACIRPLMVTGDNMLTAVSVARECRMIDPEVQVVVVSACLDAHGVLKVEFHHAQDLQMVAAQFVAVEAEEDRFVLSSGAAAQLAMSGKTWQMIRRHRPDMLKEMVVMGTVFARFSPDQKSQLVEALQDVDYAVCMCGDGANDCGALKTANAGISLSEAEASVASPFTSQHQNISCVPALIKEGRCALVTSFGVFKFMAGYSLLQFITVLLLYWSYSNLTDYQYLYIDLLTITSLCISFGYTPPSSILHPEPPPHRLINIPTVLSLILHIICFTGILIASLFYLRAQPWYFKFKGTDDDPQSYDNAVLFSVSAFQYISLSVIFSRGEPYRKSVWQNKLFLLNLIFLYGLTAYVVIAAFDGLRSLLQLWNFPNTGQQSYMFKATLVGIAATHFFLGNFIEMLINGFGFRKFIRRLRGGHRKRHSKLQNELSNHWPPISRRFDNVGELDTSVFAGVSAS